MKKKFPIFLAVFLIVGVLLYPKSLPPLTAEEIFILNPPPQEASRSAKDRHMETVSKLAMTGSKIELNENCRPTPLVLKVELGSNIKFKNRENIKRKIIIDEEHIFEIDPNSSKTIKADFKYGEADYGYVCEGVGIVGFLSL